VEPLRIRRYDDRDHDAVWRLHNLALNEVGAHAGSGPWDDDLHSIESVYLGGRGEFLVGLIGEEIVAMGALRRVANDCGQITRMRVHPRAQGRGLGRKILERLEARARELGYERLTLDTTVGQIAAQRLYRRHGYIETGRTRYGPFDVILFEKSLANPERMSNGH
jgi:ribosomal protein S18 acetylase RimI-like enzyme